MMKIYIKIMISNKQAILKFNSNIKIQDNTLKNKILINKNLIINR